MSEEINPGTKKITEEQALAEKRDGTINVKISSDRMNAYLVVTPPVSGGNPVTVDMVLKSIKDAGIKFGIDDKKIENIVETTSSVPELFASGEPPVHGQDAQIKTLFSADGNKVSPKVLDDGSVDLRNIISIDNIDAGKKLIEKIPPTKGVPGTTVTGLELKPKDGKDFRLRAGKNTHLSDDEMSVVSTAAGRPVFRQNKVSVDPIYRVTGNVDYSVGNIDFIGSVVIRGWVRDGFKVKAEGDIEIDQGVDDAFIEAGGRIEVKYGIQGGENGKISAKGDIKAGYIYNSLVYSEGSVKVRESIMNSRIYADKEIIVEGGKGLIVGGIIRAGEIVSARNIGSSLAQTTVIEVGINPALREEVLNLEKLIESKGTTLEQTKKAINLLMDIKKRIGRLNPDKERMLIKLRHTLIQLEEEVGSAKHRIGSIEEQMGKVTNPRIKVSGRIYPGVRIVIKGSIFNVHDALDNVILSEQEKEVRVSPYR